MGLRDIAKKAIINVAGAIRQDAAAKEVAASPAQIVGHVCDTCGAQPVTFDQDLRRLCVHHEAVMWKKKARDYFGVIERIEKERNEWKSMWFQQSSAAHRGQQVLEDALFGLRGGCARLIEALNVYRKEKGEALLEKIDMRGPPIGLAAEFGALLERLNANAPESVDGAAERDRIAGEGGRVA